MPSSPLPAGSQVGEGLPADARQGLQALVLQLRTDDLDLLNETVQQLNQQADAALPLMLEALLSPDEELRKNVAWVLGFQQRPEALKPLLHLLSSDSSIDVRLSASWALRQMPQPALESLIFTKLAPPQNLADIQAYLDSKSWKARWYCTVRLTFEPHAECLEALVRLARSDESTVVRCSAILSLVAYADARIPMLLCELLQDIDDHVKIEAATVLSLKNHRGAIPALARQLQAYSENVRVSVVSALGSLGDQAVIPHLATALKDSSDLVRINAAMALFDLAQRLKQRHSIIRELCLRALADKNLYVVKNAARTLGLVGDDAATKQVLTMLKSETRPTIIGNLVQAVGLMQDPRAAKPLGKLLRHESWEVRFEVVRALGQLPGAEREAYPLLLQGLKDPAVMVKEQAIHALGMIGNKKAIPHLEKLKLQHPYGKINKTIAKALDRLLGI